MMKPRAAIVGSDLAGDSRLMRTLAQASYPTSRRAAGSVVERHKALAKAYRRFQLRTDADIFEQACAPLAGIMLVFAAGPPRLPLGPPSRETAGIRGARAGLKESKR